MKLTRVIFIALAIALPASWTVARAEEPAPAEGAKKEKKAKKGKKAKADGEAPAGVLELADGLAALGRLLRPVYATEGSDHQDSVLRQPHSGRPDSAAFGQNSQ
jgi:hypothetical protein